MNDATLMYLQIAGYFGWIFATHITDATWVYLRIMGYFGWTFACFIGVPLMGKLGYIPASLSIWFALQGIALFLYITGHVIANDIIVQYGVTVTQYVGLTLVAYGLIQATKARM